MKKEIIEAICILGITQGAFLGTVFLTLRRNKTANIFLASFLFTIAIAMAGRYAAVNKVALYKYGVHYFLLVLPSLLGPLVYLYSESLMHDVKKLHVRYLGHFILPGFILVCGIALYTLYPFVPVREVTLLKYYALGVLFFSLGSGLFYILYALFRLRKHRKQVEEYFSDTEKMNLQWLQVLLTLLLAASLTWNLVIYLRFILFVKGLALFAVFSQGTIVFIVFIVAYYAIKQPEVFGMTLQMEEELEKDSPVKKENVVTDNSRKYQKQSLPAETVVVYKKHLIQYMEEKNPYLEDTLTLKDLSGRLEIPSHHLSMIINSELNLNFYFFINSY